jgi:hypothetical protein
MNRRAFLKAPAALVAPAAAVTVAAAPLVFHEGPTQPMRVFVRVQAAADEQLRQLFDDLRAYSRHPLMLPADYEIEWLEPGLTGAL